MASHFSNLIRKTRPVRARRADMIIIPRVLELERQFTARRYQGTRFWQHQDVRDFAMAFTLTFTGALVFLM